MIAWMDLVNLTMGVAGLMLTSLGLVLSLACRPMERWTRGYFIANFAILIVYTAAVTVDHFALLYGKSALLVPCIFIESLTSSLLMPMLTVYLLRLCGESRLKSPLFTATRSLWLVYLALLVYTQFTTVIYSVGADGVYRRGPLYPLLLVPPVLIMLLNLFGLSRRWRKLTGRQRHALLIYMAAPLVAMVLQMFFYGLLLVVFGTITGALAMFVFILSEQIDMAMRHARDSAEKEFGMKVLQMRPHFIYNAMMSIYYLCAQDPKKAQQVTLDFTTYLRKNFTAIASEDTVPFSDELEHTRAYLAVEQVQFEDGLLVDYNTPHKEFRVPPLTLQPIVENAVKHGMDPENAPLRISIRTRATDAGSEIIVEDNGPGFAPDDDNQEPHIALANIRQRLEMMCGGKLAIQPREGGGTAVKVTIPYDAQKGEHSASGKRFLISFSR